MIIQWIWDALSSALSWVISILPAPTLPSWLTSAPASIQSFMGNVGAFGNWLPVTVISEALVFLLLALAAGGAIKLIRIIASFLTAGGGSAA